jgi:regulator of sigma E protease
MIAHSTLTEIITQISPIATSILGFIFLISVLVFFHEFGHFYAARKLGVKVEVFSIGFGKALLKWHDKLGTRWQIAWIPIGGYVKMKGDADSASTPDLKNLQNMSKDEKKETFHFQSIWKKALIIFAGPATNYILAIAIFACFAYINGVDITSTEVTHIVDNMPGAIGGMEIGDKISAIDDKEVKSLNDLRNIVNLSNGKTLLFTVKRNNEIVSLEIRPIIKELDDPAYGKVKIPTVGLGFNKYTHISPGPIIATKYAINYAYDMSWMILNVIKQIIFGQRDLQELSGPIKIAQYSGRTLNMGFGMMLRLMAIISLNLGLINLLPIPLLDGGHLFMYAIEAIYGKPIPKKVQDISYKIGLVLLITLMLLSTCNDIKSIFMN